MRSRLAVIVTASLLISVPASAETGCALFQHRDYAASGAYWYMARNSFMQMGGKPVGATGYIAYYQPSWNDQVSSFQVNGGRGCTLTLYQHAGSWGYGSTFRSNRSYLYVGSSWNDQASWAECACSGPPQH
jgi:syncollin